MSLLKSNMDRDRISLKKADQGDALRVQNGQNDEGLSKLISISEDTAIFEEIKLLRMLAEVSIESCLARMRTVAGKLAYYALEKKGIRLSENNFFSSIYALRQNKLLSSKSIGYLHMIRVIGNLAAHALNEVLTEVDVRILSEALACVIEELKENELIQ